MKPTKMSLATIQGRLSRAEMKNIMAGSGTGCPANPCGGGGNGTCQTGIDGGTIGCVCSVQPGTC